MVLCYHPIFCFVFNSFNCQTSYLMSCSKISWNPSFYFILFVLITVGFPRSSNGKESACNTGDPGLIPGTIWYLSWKDPLEKGMPNHSSILLWRIPWTEEAGGLQSRRLQRVGQNWVTCFEMFCVIILFFVLVLTHPTAKPHFWYHVQKYNEILHSILIVLLCVRVC